MGNWVSTQAKLTKGNPIRRELAQTFWSPPSDPRGTGWLCLVELLDFKWASDGVLGHKRFRKSTRRYTRNETGANGISTGGAVILPNERRLFSEGRQLILPIRTRFYRCPQTY